MFIFCCFATSAFAQEAVDADTFMTTTETITEVKTTPEIAETATAFAETTPDTIGELALGLNTVWMLLAAMLVFFMQPGFALVEAGFTRVKNTTNILMKNFVDFMFGSLLYWFIGFGLMFGAGGFIGMPHFFDLSFLDSDLPKEGFLVFRQYFAQRQPRLYRERWRNAPSSPCIWSIPSLSAYWIYPISGHWTWGGGWLMNGEEGSFMMNLSERRSMTLPVQRLSTPLVVWIALVGAAILGPRIGKYGKDGKSRAIPGHNLTVAALGVFILWFGWFGFNPGSQLAASTEADAMAISHVFLTTNLAACAGGFFALAVSWMKYGKPSLSLTLNGVLAGLVGITAGCDAVAPSGAVLIGAICGVVMIFAVDFIDKVLKIDDPVGASSVHGFVVSWEQCSQDCSLPVRGCSTDMEPAFGCQLSVRLLSESGRQVWDSLSSKYSTRFTDFAFQHVSKKKVSTSTNTENLLYN